MKRLILTFVVALAATPAAAQVPASIVPAPVPAPTNGCTPIYNSTLGQFECLPPSAASQPLSDAFPLIADNANSTKRLAFELSGISSATTRTWTIPDANITIPPTIASLAANTFTALQTMNGGLASTTGTFSSTLSVTGLTTLTGGVSGGISVSGTIRVTDTTGATTGSMSKNATYGLTFVGVTGSSNDLAILDPSTNEIMKVPTGTVRTHWLGNMGIKVAPSSTVSLNVANPSADFVASFTNSHGSTPYGLNVAFSGAAPNNTSQYFASFTDTVGVKARLMTDGGWHNFSGNNVNLSDAITKDLKSQVESLRGKFSQIKLYRGRYKNSNRAADDVMWTAQEIAAIDPNWTDVFQQEERDAEGNITRPMLLGTRDNQIFMANVAVTIEHEALIVGLQQQVTALSARLQKLEARGQVAAVSVPHIGRIY